MKKAAIFLINVCFSIWIGSGFSQTGPSKSSFQEQSFDFGEVKKGEIVKHIFSIENTSNSSVLLTEAITQCGCTVPELPKENIDPGETAEILIAFDTSGKVGYQRKTIKIYLNNGDEIKLILYAQIIE